MKKIYCVFIMTFLFLSCSQNEARISSDSGDFLPQEESSLDGPIEEQVQEADAPNNELDNIGNIDDIFGIIPADFKEDESFLQCSAQSIDQCILSSQSPERPLTLEICDDLLLDSNKEGCKLSLITSQAVESGNVSQCDQLEFSESCKYEVYVSLGMSEGKPELCDLLSNELKAQCNNTIVQNLIYETLDETWCDRFMPDFATLTGEGGEDEMLQSLKQDCLTNIESTKLMNAEFAAQEEANIDEEGIESSITQDDTSVEEEGVGANEESVVLPTPEEVDESVGGNTGETDQPDTEENNL